MLAPLLGRQLSPEVTFAGPCYQTDPEELEEEGYRHANKGRCLPERCELVRGLRDHLQKHLENNSLKLQYSSYYKGSFDYSKKFNTAL